MTGAKPISVFLVEDHPLFRKGLRQVLEEAPDLRVAGEATDGEEALALIPDLEVQVLLLDLRLPGGSGLELVKEVRRHRPEIAAIFLSAYDHPHYVQAAVEAGAAGYLLKDEPAPRILEAIRGAARGRRRCLSRGLGDRLEELAPEPLTQREQEIVSLLAGGRSLDSIAGELGISLRTVRNHLNNVYSKLDLHSQTELVAWAWRTGCHGQELP